MVRRYAQGVTLRYDAGRIPDATERRRAFDQADTRGFCESCGAHSDRRLHAYWGPWLCPPCAIDMAAAYDSLGAWPGDGHPAPAVPARP
jgi:hypothetical protein